MKPAPATSVRASSGLSGRAAIMAAASSRGFLRAVFARRIATLLAKSPCCGSRVRSTTTASGAGICGSTPPARRVREASSNCSSCSFKATEISCRAGAEVYPKLRGDWPHPDSSGCGRSSVHITPVADCGDESQQCLVLNIAGDSIVAGSIAPIRAELRTLERLASTARVLGGCEPLPEEGRDAFRFALLELAELFDGGCRQFNPPGQEPARLRPACKCAPRPCARAPWSRMPGNSPRDLRGPCAPIPAGNRPWSVQSAPRGDPGVSRSQGRVGWKSPRLGLLEYVYSLYPGALCFSS